MCEPMNCARDGMNHGRDFEHWHAAECELLAKRGEMVSAKTPAAKPKRKTKSAKSKM